MTKKNKAILDSFKEVAINLKSNPTPPEYWDKEEVILRDLMIESEKVAKDLSMSSEKFNKIYGLKLILLK